MEDNVVNYTADDGNVSVVDFDEASSQVKVSVISSIVNMGQAVTSGGKTGQVYTKLSDKDYDAGWVDNIAEGVEGIKGSNETTYSKGYYEITPDKIGLGNVDNTSDLDKPISNAQKQVNDKISQDFDAFKQAVSSQISEQAERIESEANARSVADTALSQSLVTESNKRETLSQDFAGHKTNVNNPHNVNKEQVGLSNVTNDTQVKRSEMGIAQGVATLDENAKVPTSQLPDYILGQIVYGGNAKGSPTTYVPSSPIQVGDSISTLFFNTDITPDFSQLDWSAATQLEAPEEDGSGGAYMLTLMSTGNESTSFTAFMFKDGYLIDSVAVSGDAYYMVWGQDMPFYATDNLADFLEGHYGWLQSSQTLESAVTVSVVSQQDVWGGWVAKTNEWSAIPGSVTATLTTSAQAKLNTSLESIVLTDDEANLSGYTANYGLYYTCISKFDFGAESFNIGDWLISNGRAWTKVDNTDAISGVKGSAETKYRTGLVNITQANIGIYKFYYEWANFENTGAGDDDYPYTAFLKLNGLNSTDQIANVYFSSQDVKSNKFAPYCETVYVSDTEGVQLKLFANEACSCSIPAIVIS